MSAAINAGTMNNMGRGGATLLLPRALVPLLLTAAALIAALFAGRAVQPALNRPLAHLRIEGVMQHLSPAQIAAAAAVPPHARIFDADLGTLRERIEALPWTARARVSRVWPDTLEIRVWERVPAARWGDSRLLDSDGQAFTPPADDLQPPEIQALPKLGGPSGREIEVMNAYRGLAAALKSSEFAPQAVTLDARGEWRMDTAYGAAGAGGHDIELRLGDADPLSQVPLLLGTVSHTLAAYIDQIAYIDLRYSNGFSVGWVNGGDCNPLHPAGKGHAPAVQGCGGTPAGTAPAAAADIPGDAPALAVQAAKAAAPAGSAPAAPPAKDATKKKATVVAPAAAKEVRK